MRQQTREGNEMFTVQDDWIEYERTAVPARRVAVRGGAACAQRLPLAHDLRTVPTRAVVRSVPARSAELRPVRRPRLRLTRRGRVVLVVLPALLALSGALLAVAPGTAEAATPGGRPVAHRTLVVGTGDTLWTIAERVAPREDPRLVVAALQQANGLSGSEIQAGELLVLPAG